MMFSFTIQTNIQLEAIRSSVEYRINQAEIQINEIDDDSKSSISKIAEAEIGRKYI